MANFTNRSWRTVSRLSTDDRPIVSRRSADSKPFAKSQRQSADLKKIVVSYNCLQPADSKKRLKSHTESADCRLIIGRFASLTVRRQSVGSM